MKNSSKEMILDYRAADLYNIVLDIEEYPNYIPWCSKIEILKKNNTEIKAIMIVKYKFFPTQKFTSNVYFNFDKLIIKTRYIDGPLKDLDTSWIFEEIKKNQCKILFNVEFEFENFLHQRFAEFFFPLIENKMINSFIKRAEQILN